MIEYSLDTFNGIITNKLTEIQLESYFEGYIDAFRDEIQSFKERYTLEGFNRIETFLEDGTKTNKLWNSFKEIYFKKLF
jgi:hypothetical protein